VPRLTGGEAVEKGNVAALINHRNAPEMVWREMHGFLREKIRQHDPQAPARAEGSQCLDVENSNCKLGVSTSTNWNYRRMLLRIGIYGPARGSRCGQTERTSSRLSIQGMRCCSLLIRSIIGTRSSW
jgi:hypothetical protein